MEILGRFDRALCLLTVCHQSLAAKESAVVGDEEEVLRQGIRLLRGFTRSSIAALCGSRAKRGDGSLLGFPGRRKGADRYLFSGRR